MEERTIPQGKDRLIVALDVPTHENAIHIVDRLTNVNFFKIGLELLLAGHVFELVEKLQERRREQGGIFIDLKLPGDIGNTLTRFIEACARLHIKFITLADPTSYMIASKTISTAVKARGQSGYPKILVVPLLSSLDTYDLLGAGDFHDSDASDATEYILERGEKLLDEGCDGLIVSGKAIERCRSQFPDSLIVSPGIRPKGSSSDDHKRSTTPGDAIKMGSDYLVVGRPVLNSDDMKKAAQEIIDEIDMQLSDQALTS